MQSGLKTLATAAGIFLAMTLLCGVIYTAVCTGIGQLVFPFQANGSIVTGNDGKQYSMILGQEFSDENHLWGRVVNTNTETFTDKDGNALEWAGPSNLSPASEDYRALVAERVAMIEAAHPEKEGIPIPNDLVTCSGSGLDPDISPAAAEYQVERLAKSTGKTPEEIRDIIAACTTGPTFGVLGDSRVNVLKVNLMLDGVL